MVLLTRALCCTIFNRNAWALENCCGLNGVASFTLYVCPEKCTCAPLLLNVAVTGISDVGRADNGTFALAAELFE